MSFVQHGVAGRALPVSATEGDCCTKTMQCGSAFVSQDREISQATETAPPRTPLLLGLFRWLQEIRGVGFCPNYSPPNAQATRPTSHSFTLIHAKISPRFALRATIHFSHFGLLKRPDDPHPQRQRLPDRSRWLGTCIACCNATITLRRGAQHQKRSRSPDDVYVGYQSTQATQYRGSAS